MEQKAFRDILKEKGLKATGQRMLVLETMASHPGEHLTAEEIYNLVRAVRPEIGLATIYRTVQVLAELQLIDRINFDDGFARYELAGTEGDSGHHHHHAICSRCGRVLSFEEDLLDNLEQAVRERMGFVVTDHEVKLFGVCAECAEKRNNK